MDKKRNKGHYYECISCGRSKCLPHQTKDEVIKWCRTCSPKIKGKKTLFRRIRQVRGQRKLTQVL